jgi:hypothetical protein
VWYENIRDKRDPLLASVWNEQAQANGSWAAKADTVEKEIVSMAPGDRSRPVRQWDAHDQYQMGLNYERGKGVPFDPEQAVAWYRLAATGFVVPAQRRLGLALLKGQSVAKDEAEAAFWLNLASEQGDAEAMSALAEMYAQGSGVVRDDRRSFELFEKAAKAGITDAQYSLGTMYLKGRGVKKNADKATEWLEQAAMRSDVATLQMLLVLQDLAK